MVDDFLAGFFAGRISCDVSAIDRILLVPLPNFAISSGDPPELVEVFDNACAAIEENPNDVQAHFMRGVICQGKRCYEAALADFATVIRLQPQHARAWLLAGEVLHSLGEYEQSQTARQQALAIDPSVG